MDKEALPNLLHFPNSLKTHFPLSSTDDSQWLLWELIRFLNYQLSTWHFTDFQKSSPEYSSLCNSLRDETVLNHGIRLGFHSIFLVADYFLPNPLCLDWARRDQLPAKHKNPSSGISLKLPLCREWIQPGSIIRNNNKNCILKSAGQFPACNTNWGCQFDFQEIPP